MLSPTPERIELSPLSRYFATYLCRLVSNVDPSVMWALQLVSHKATEGHVCIKLNAFAGHCVQGSDTELPFTLPPLNEWVARLYVSGLVGKPGDFTPLILVEDTRLTGKGHRLYLARYWDYEKRLAENLVALAKHPVKGVDIERLQKDLDILFPRTSSSSCSPDFQKLAAALAVLQRVCIISGGPGTGKTSTVLRILIALQSQAGKEPLRIALTAPTGKAAARIEQALREQRSQMTLPESLSANLPHTACTLHRLLKTQRDSVYFYHHRDNPLLFDVVVVDEASMVDIALFAKLVDALPAQGRLILLGDKDQLAPVETGAVFGELCKTLGYSQEYTKILEKIVGFSVPTREMFVPVLSNCIAYLYYSYRFSSQSGIGALTEQINRGSVTRAIEILGRTNHSDLFWDRENTRHKTDLAEYMEKAYAHFLDAVDKKCDAKTLLRCFDTFRVLTAHRSGQRGVIGVNRLFEERLVAQGRIPRGKQWYFGRPILITCNHYPLSLFNGDIGITLWSDDEEYGQPRYRVYFEDEKGELRSFAPESLPEHETVYAMTVHKSQGSEFDTILLLLPESDSPVLNRSLLYTALTRAKKHVTVRGSQAIIEAGIRRLSSLESGIQEYLSVC